MMKTQRTIRIAAPAALLFGIAAVAGAQAQRTRPQPVVLRNGSADAAPAAPPRSTLVFAGRPLDEWISASVDDTSLYRRDRAISALRRAPAAIRAQAVRQFTASLASPAQERRARALQAMGQLAIETQGQVGRFDGTNDLLPALPTVARIAGERADPLRGSAMWLLAEAGRRGREHSLPVARAAVRDPDPSVREASLAILGAAGDSSDVSRITDALTDRELDVRVRAAGALGALGRKEGVPHLMRTLGDSSRMLRAATLQSLARLGPIARPALPAVSALVNDTTNWRAGGSYAETIGAEAAWAVSRILPRRGVGMIPARVDIDDRDSGLRDDGLGTYVAGGDSVKAYVSAALNLDLSGPRGDGRATRLSAVRKLPRYLAFDLTRPVTGSGARALGVVKDNEAIIHLFWKHEHDKRMISITQLDPLESAVECERAEFEFRVNGEPYLLQMGEWTEGEFNPRAPRVHGNGTTPPRIWHLNADEWTVIASPGSKARLWNMSDPSHPVDKGLYTFPFAITWAAMLPR